MNVVSVKTAYSNIEEYKFELDILRDSLLTPERPLDVLREDVFKAQRAIKPLPSLEERRKELSRLVSEDYQVQYNNELQLRVNEYLLDTDDESDGISKRIADITVNQNLKGIFSYNNNLEQADLEALYEKYGLDDEADFDKGLGTVTKVQGSVKANKYLVTSENQIEHLGKTSVDTELEVPNIQAEDTADESSTDEPSAEVQPIEESDLSGTDNSEIKGIDTSETNDNAEDTEFEEASDEEDVDDVDDEEESDNLEDEDLEDDSEGIDDSVDEDDSEGIDDSVDEDDSEGIDDSVDEDESEGTDESEDESDSADEFEDVDEDLEDEDSIDEDEDLEDEDSIDEDADSEDEDLEDDDSEDEDLEDTENIDEIELDDTVVKPKENKVSQQSKPYTSNSPRDGNKLDNSSTLIDNILDSDDEVDLENFNANIENSSTDSSSKGTTNSSPTSAQPTGIDESDTKDLRQFLRNNPRCDYNDVLKYFSKREITRELSRGRIIKKGSKLKPI